jgi:hypothetical protein
MVDSDPTSSVTLKEFKKPFPKFQPSRSSNTDPDFDVAHLGGRLTKSTSSLDPKQLQWAKNESRSMRAAGTGRGAAVTGHAGKAKVKSGGGSLRSGLGLKTGGATSGSGEAAGVGAKPKAVRKETSVLSKMGDSRSRFTS